MQKIWVKLGVEKDKKNEGNFVGVISSFLI